MQKKKSFKKNREENGKRKCHHHRGKGEATNPKKDHDIKRKALISACPHNEVTKPCSNCETNTVSLPLHLRNSAVMQSQFAHKVKKTMPTCKEVEVVKQKASQGSKLEDEGKKTMISKSLQPHP